MASIKAILNKEKPVEKDEKIKDKTFPIYIRLHHKQKRKYVSIGRWVKESQWDEEAGLVRKSHTDYVAINAIITKEKKRLNDEVLWHLATEESTDVISGIRKREKKETLNNFFIVSKMYFAQLKKGHKYNRISADEPRINRLKKFNKSGDLKFEDVDVAFLKRFQTYLKSEFECSDRTIMNHLVAIRTLYNYAIREGIADKNFYPFGKDKILIKFPESFKIGLNTQEVNAIEEADFSYSKHLQITKDVWLFSFYLAGIRISDVFRLKWKDFVDGRINYIMGKNGKVVSLKLPEKAVAILDRYRNENSLYTDYVFGILTEEDESHPKKLYKAIAAGTHKINRGLKTIAEKLSLSKKLTCHISRHTFGNITGDKISPQMLQKLYRHTDIKTTMGYQANFIHTEMDNALDSVLNF